MCNTPTTPYVGRFAPSPTGQLHIGSLIAALASFLDARAHDGQWLMRVEDLDPPREIPGAADQILTALRDHGLTWDGETLWQSQRHDAYHAALEQLLAREQAFFCTCSRKQLQGLPTYPGNCRHCHQPPNQPAAIRLRVDADTLCFEDRIQGQFCQDLSREVGDFIIFRKDRLFAYQLAVVLDDHFQGVTDVIRGADLLDSTPRQIYLQQQLNLPTPRYGHLPVITNRAQQKLSKQTFAQPLDSRFALDNLRYALDFLQQPPAPPEQRGSIERLLNWAIDHWRSDLIPRERSRIARGDFTA